MKWVDEWPADISLGDRNEIHVYFRGHIAREKRKGSWEKKREEEMLDSEEVGVFCTIATDQSTLSRSPLARTLGLFSPPPPLFFIPIFTPPRLQPPSPAHAGLSTPVQGRRIYSDEDFSGRNSNFNAFSSPLPFSSSRNFYVAIFLLNRYILKFAYVVWRI